jgi:uncharacterized protein
VRLWWKALRLTGATLVAGYLSIAGYMSWSERTILYRLGDRGGALAANGGVAVPGSERVSITAADGTKLAAWYRPAAAGRPTFLFLHGQGGSLVAQTTRWEQLSERGWGVLALSYRGYPMSDGTPTEEGLALDARAAFGWLAGKVPPDTIVIHGHSLGSGVATRLAADVPARALVLEAPFTAASDLGAERYPWLPVRLLMRDQYRSRDRVALVKSPLLIVHGDADIVVPFAHGERLFALGREPKAFVRVPGGGHNTLAATGLYDHVAAFLAR